MNKLTPFAAILALLLCCFELISAAHGGTVERMLPGVYREGQDISGWLISEKLDGVRGYWDGNQLWSKNGKALHPPAELVRKLPDFHLEGELWGGRGTFETTVSIVLQQAAEDDWLRLKFAIFDVPQVHGTFTRRLTKAQAWFAAHPSPYAFVIPQTPIRDGVHLQEELQRIKELGGEGLIVRNPEALYSGGRSTEILKVKDFEDAEAVVVGHIPGRGRNEGRLGALLAELPNGTRFRIGTGFSDDERRNPPPIGEIITFKYFGYYRSGIPKFPSFLRIRQDRDLQ
jgi:DNA ligase 1